MPADSAPTIIAGEYKGRRLAVPAGRTVRPTRSLVRGALYDMVGPAVVDAAALDLFAGAGALGLEALSRGARHMVFVERDRRARRALTANLATCGVPADRHVLLPLDADDLLPADLPAAGVPFDLVLLDPPFARPSPLPERLLRGLPLTEDPLLVLHADAARAVPTVLGPWTLQRRRAHGRSAICLYRTA